VDSRYVVRRSEIILRRMQGRRFVPFPEEVEAEERPAEVGAPLAVPDTIREGSGDAEPANGGVDPGDRTSEPAQGTPSPADSAGGG
jgi:hypothetical protein